VAEAKFGITDVVVEILTLGEAKWTGTVSDFSKGPDGWLGPVPPGGRPARILPIGVRLSVTTQRPHRAC